MTMDLETRLSEEDKAWILERVESRRREIDVARIKQVCLDHIDGYSPDRFNKASSQEIGLDCEFIFENEESRTKLAPSGLQLKVSVRPGSGPVKSHLILGDFGPISQTDLKFIEKHIWGRLPEEGIKWGLERLTQVYPAVGANTIHHLTSKPYSHLQLNIVAVKSMGPLVEMDLPRAIAELDRVDVLRPDRKQECLWKKLNLPNRNRNYSHSINGNFDVQGVREDVQNLIDHNPVASDFTQAYLDSRFIFDKTEEGYQLKPRERITEEIVSVLESDRNIEYITKKVKHSLRALTDLTFEDILELESVKIPGYEVYERLGGGDDGVVFLVERKDDIRKKFALKVFTKEKVVKGELDALSKLVGAPQANLVTVFESLTVGYGGKNCKAYLMEHLNGPSARDVINMAKKWPLEYETIERFFQDVSNGVDSAESKGVVQSDLRPENIKDLVEGNLDISSDRRFKIFDFGKCGSDEPGSRSYSTPTDLLKKNDWFGLALITYELATGEYLFDPEAHGDKNERKKFKRQFIKDLDYRKVVYDRIKINISARYGQNNSKKIVGFIEEAFKEAFADPVSRMEAPSLDLIFDDSRFCYEAMYKY